MGPTNRRRVLVVAAALVFSGVVSGCAAPPQTALEQLIESRRLTAEMLVQLEAADGATSRAVMADTDDASLDFTNGARRAIEQVEQDRAAIGPLLEAQRFREEGQLLGEFTERFRAFAELTERVLDLAVMNTNGKAQRLSFGPAFGAADAFRDALLSLRPATPENRDRMAALTSTAVAAVREIQAIQAPHIAEADDDAMTRLETRMAGAHHTARTALDGLAAVVHPDSRTGLAAATQALRRFMDLNTEIVALSRKNSDVRSLALSLGDKRQRLAACQETLRALQSALAARGFAGTR